MHLRHLPITHRTAIMQEHLRHSAIQRSAIKACLDRLYMVSNDSESLGFIESCKPVIAQAEAALNIEP